MEFTRFRNIICIYDAGESSNRLVWLRFPNIRVRLVI